MLTLCTFTLFAQKFEVRGKIVDSQSKNGIASARVDMVTQSVSTNSAGVFVFSNIDAGDFVLSVSADGFETKRIPIKVTSSVDLGTIDLINKGGDSESGLGELTLSSEDEGKDQAVSALLNATNDVFVSAASYQFGPLFFRMRGLDGKYNSVYMNSVNVNDAETGRAVFSEWGGLNDVIRNRESANGLEPTQFALGGLGGTSNIDTRASMQRKGLRASYALSNRTYNNRLMATYSSGLMQNGWAYTVGGSRRWAQEGYFEGTFNDAYAWFVGAEKKLSENHSLAFTAYGAPYRRGQSSAITQEVADMMGHYYNPNWGWQDGEKRNARVRESHEPMFNLTHYWKINETVKLTTSAAYSFGKTGTTGLNWYNSSDPRPDYYRYLPSYDTIPWIASDVRNAWLTDQTVSQIDWDELYQTNYLANSENKQARYIIENNVTEQNQFYLNSHANVKTGTIGTLSAGVEFSHYKGQHYKVLDDLLGGMFWVDIDQFAERDFTGDSIAIQNDLNNPNRVVKEGDKFGYNYILYQTTATVWALQQFTFSKFDAYVGVAFNYNSFYREGLMRNGLHPDNSYGKSKVNSDPMADVKVGGTYKINGRNYIKVNAARLMRSPELRDAYLSPRTQDRLSTEGAYSDGSSNNRDDIATILSGDISYIVRYPNFNARVTAYQTNFTNNTEIMRFYHDDYKTYVNMVLTGEDITHQGIEVGMQAKITSWLSAVAVGSFGNFRYTNRPMGTINFDNGSQPDTTEMIYLKNFYVGGTPQIASAVGLKFNRNYWFIDINLNYFDKIYLPFNPERRTQKAIENLDPGDPQIATITEQQKLDGGFTLDASIGKSWRINGKYFLNVNFQVSNILNNTDLITGGYEQLRFDFETKNVNKFPPKYYYAMGRNFFFNVGIRF